MTAPSSNRTRALGWATCLLLPGFFVLTLLLIPSGTTLSSSAGQFVIPVQVVGLLAGLWGIPAGVGILRERGWGREMALGMAVLMVPAIVLWAPLVILVVVQGNAEPDERWMVGITNGAYLAYFGGHAVWTLNALWYQSAAQGGKVRARLARIAAPFRFSRQPPLSECEIGRAHV